MRSKKEKSLCETKGNKKLFDLYEENSSAYKLYHEFQTGAPCLSFDVISDDVNRSNSAYPATTFIVAGTNSQTARDHLIVLKLSNMHEQEEPVDLDDDEEEPPVDPGNYLQLQES